MVVCWYLYSRVYRLHCKPRQSGSAHVSWVAWARVLTSKPLHVFNRQLSHQAHCLYTDSSSKQLPVARRTAAFFKLQTGISMSSGLLIKLSNLFLHILGWSKCTNFRYLKLCCHEQGLGLKRISLQLIVSAMVWWWLLWAETNSQNAYFIKETVWSWL